VSYGSDYEDVVLCDVFRVSLVRADVSEESLLFLSTMMLDAIISSETSVLTRAKRRHITEDGILQHCIKEQRDMPCSLDPKCGHPKERSRR
jgi:hypothetical protein